VAANWGADPFATVGFDGVTLIAVSVAALTVSVVCPFWPPCVALRVAFPGAEVIPFASRRH